MIKTFPSLQQRAADKITLNSKIPVTNLPIPVVEILNTKPAMKSFIAGCCRDYPFLKQENFTPTDWLLSYQYLYAIDFSSATLPKVLATILQEFNARPSIPALQQQQWESLWNDEKNKLALLLSEKCPVTVSDRNGETPLHYAAQQGYIGLVQSLLRKGADLNVETGSKRTPLHLAIFGNQPTTACYLIKNGAEINPQDEMGWTPLNLATTHNRIVIVNELLWHTTVDVNLANRFGNTPLHMAEHWQHLECIQALLARGANPDLVNKEGQTPAQYRDAEAAKKKMLCHYESRQYQRGPAESSTAFGRKKISTHRPTFNR